MHKEADNEGIDPIEASGQFEGDIVLPTIQVCLINIFKVIIIVSKNKYTYVFIDSNYKVINKLN